MVETRCSVTGEELSMAFRLQSDEEHALHGDALERGDTQITVTRFCPFCMKSHQFELPLPQEPSEQSEQLLRVPLHFEPMKVHSPVMRDISRTPVGDLHRDFWKAEKLARSTDPEDLKQAAEMLPRFRYRYEDMDESRSAAAAEVLLAQARLGLGENEGVRDLLEHALEILDEKLDREMVARAKELLGDLCPTVKQP
jgi:hypothetical protein